MRGAIVVITIARFRFGLRGSESRAPLEGVVAIVCPSQGRRRRVGHGRGGGRHLDEGWGLWVQQSIFFVSEWTSTISSYFGTHLGAHKFWGLASTCSRYTLHWLLKQDTVQTRHIHPNEWDGQRMWPLFAA